jgi:hypothetical protein
MIPSKWQRTGVTVTVRTVLVGLIGFGLLVNGATEPARSQPREVNPPRTGTEGLSLLGRNQPAPVDALGIRSLPAPLPGWA